MIRVLAATLGAFAVIASPQPVRADTVNFTAQLGPEADSQSAGAAAKGIATLSLDTATKTVSWNIEYFGLSAPAQGVGCGALDSPTGPAIWLRDNLASPIKGAKQLDDQQVAALGAGRWVCVVGGDEAEIGGELKPAK